MIPLLTIAIPTYNRRDFIPIALNSILQQYDERVEILVSDNCSTDNTRELILEKYPMVRYACNNENIGPDRNFLECYKKSNGKFVLLLGDDDILLPNSIQLILDFLSKNLDVSLVFLNHTGFVGECVDLEHCNKPFVSLKRKGFVTTDKTRFIKVAKHELTFMSSFIVNSKRISEINNIDRYLGTSFIHTCIAFEISKDNNSLLGYIPFVCVAQNQTENNKNCNSKWIFEVFGNKEKHVICEIGRQCGYPIKDLKKIHSDFVCHSWPVLILSFKARRVEGWQENFWLYGYPAVKEYKKIWITIMPALIFPDVFARIAKRIKNKKVYSAKKVIDD